MGLLKFSTLKIKHAVIVAFMSFSSWLVSFALSYLGIMKDQVAVFTAGVICLSVVAVCSVILFKDVKSVDPLMYVATVFSWTCMIDLGIALELDGFISNFIGYYFAEGEPYLNTAHGTLINYWDGTVHFALYLAMVVLFFNRLSYREVGLYWAGSILNSMIVLLPGAVTGNHPFKLSIFLNTPYILLPIIAAVKLLHERPPQARSFLRFPNIWQRPIDLFFFIYFGLAISISVYRVLAALGGNFSSMKTFVKEYDPYLQDPSNFPFVQVMAYGYFFVAYSAFSMYGLLCPGQHWMADWSLIYAGAAAQGQVTYVLGACHHRTNMMYQLDSKGSEVKLFYSVNLLFLLVPQLFAIWCSKDAEKFGRTQTIYRYEEEQNGQVPEETSDYKKRF